MDSSLENETKIQCRTAFQRILKACENYTNLEQLLIASKAYADDEIMTLILDKISKVFLNYLYITVDIFNIVYVCTRILVKTF